MSREHDFEPVPGLPERLPQGERILWQGAPHWPTLARRAMHTHKIAGYFGIIAAWQLFATLNAGGAFAPALVSTAILVGVAAVPIALFAAYAWLVQRTTLYTITNRRVVLRVGVAVSITINLPFAKVERAAVKRYGNGAGEISLAVGGAQRISYLILWPHARRWRLARPEPTLRAIPEVDRVAGLLAEALEAAAEGRELTAKPAAPEAEPAAEPAPAAPDWRRVAAAAG